MNGRRFAHAVASVIWVSRYTLVVNLRTARELGITIPQPILPQTDKVTE
jgi:hypothetical protein